MTTTEQQVVAALLRGSTGLAERRETQEARRAGYRRSFTEVRAWMSPRARAAMERPRCGIDGCTQPEGHS